MESLVSLAIAVLSFKPEKFYRGTSSLYGSLF